MEFKHLFSPIKIGKMTVPNRVVQVPTDISSANADGSVNERVIAYHEELAKGGTGFIIVGASTPDKDTGRPTVTCLSVDADYYIPGLHELTAAMQQHGARTCVQIQHPGRQAAYPKKGLMSCSDMVADIPGSAGHEVIYAGAQAKGKDIRGMTVEEIYDLIEKFAEAAWRVKEAGFDSVELHGAHGYMIAQFMSPYTNKRNDRFGGSLKNRLRFPLSILELIRHKCGTDYPVGIRYSGEEWMPGSRTLDESIEVAKMFENAGFDFLDISAGIFEAAGPTMDPMYYKEGWNTYTSEAIKKAVDIPVITSHTLRNPAYCEKIIAEGKTDMVGLSRQLIADPYWANKAKADKVKEIRKCISCLIGCWKESLYTKRHMRCAINPATGDERFLDINPARTSMKVAVIGGGIAGMEAARIATLRGHKVTIFEKADELGGVLRSCCAVQPKSKMKWYMDWLRQQIAKLGIEVKLNTTADKNTVKGYDVVLVGTGARPVAGEFPGADKMVSYEDVLACTKKGCEYWPSERTKNPAEVGQKVLIWGNHYAATDTAEALAMKGKEVIIVTEEKQFAPDIEAIHKEVMMMRFSGGNGQALEGTPIKIPVQVKTGTTILEIKKGQVTLINDDLEKETLEIETVVNGNTEPNNELYEAVAEAGLKVANIGDSRMVRNVRGAMTDGANAGLMIDDDIFMNANNVLSNALPQDVRKMMA
jgi:2,4-dienoyl-CoA reductase-like NADH-dependent reductase (Old Yellow Enzyme family)/thioredoxin reductase